MQLSELEEHYHAFYSTRELYYDQREHTGIAEYLDYLRRELELKRVASQSQEQHGESMAQGATILSWTKAAVWAAILVPLIVLGLSVLLSDIHTSKSRPSTSS